MAGDWFRGGLALLVLAFVHRGDCQVCPFGWLDRAGSDSCYLVSTDSTRYKYPDAVDKCESHSGQLVIFTDTAERDWLLDRLSDATESFPSVDSWWLGIQFQDGKYSWLDNTPLDNSIIPWDKGLPGDTQGPCVALVRQSVTNVSCAQWCNLLCERQKSVPLQCDVDNQWNFINGSCFKIYSDRRTWPDARQVCELQDSQLAKVASFTAHADLWDAAKRLSVNLWVGLEASNNSSHLQLTWTDGTQLTASEQNFWADGQPGPPQNTSQCMYIDGAIPRRLKSWHLGDCDTLYGYVCQKPQGVCEDGWLTHQKTCFKLFDDMQPWTVANLTCSSIGGQLVNLASPSDQTFLQRYLPVFASEYVDTVWIGLSDNGNDYGPITWTSGTTVSNSSHWAQNPPPANTVGNLDCGFLDTGDPEGRWQLTSDCTQIRSWVCTLPVNTPVLPMPTSLSPYQCAPGWIQFGVNCFFFSDGPERWVDARRTCQTFDADLAVVTGDRDQAFLNRHVTGGDFWIGLQDIVSEGTWVWISNTRPIYFHWAPGEPNSMGNEDCVAIFGTKGISQNGLWNDYDCSRLCNYICQKTAIKFTGTTSSRTTTTKPAVWSSKCGEFWEERPGSDTCYQFHSQLQDYPSATATCSSYNGTLVSISSQVEQSYLAGRAQSLGVGEVWIGATDVTNEGGWYWTDNTPFAYVNWDSGEPDNEGNNQDCAVMVTKSTRWHDFGCDLKFGFICKKNAYVTTRPPLLTTPPPSGMYYGCPSGWLGYDYNCYLTVTTPASWTDSQSRCRAAGAELATINSRLENNFLVSQLPKIICNNVHQDDSECQQWAADGECDRNPVWMSLNCRHACDMCHVPCADLHTHAQCREWAATGECQENPSWMFANCALSCGACDAALVDPGLWLGLTDARVPGEFSWADNSPVRFTNWAINEPYGGGSLSGCTTVFTSGQWYKRPCSTQAGYVCKQPMSIRAQTSISPFQIGCPATTIGYGALCYLFVDNLPTSWTAAESYCNSKMGGHLVTVNAMAVQLFISAELVNRVSAPHYWIGLSDTASPGIYRWSSGNSLRYTAWGSNHTGNERSTCVALTTSRPVGLWENLACSFARPFVCEMPRRGYTTTTATTPATTTTPAPCPNGWLGYLDVCYKAFSDSGVQTTWNGARTFCRSLGGDLASVHNGSLHDFFRSQLLRSVYTGNFWIGLTDVDKEGTYLWSDGSPFDFARWVTGEPNNMNGAEDCVAYVTFATAWNDDDCFVNNPFICGLPRGQPLLTTLSAPATTPVPMCDGTQWFANGGSCYYLSPPYGADAKKTFFAARRFCQSNGAELASISSNSVNSFLVHILTQRQTSDARYWIGLNKLGGGSLEWTDASPLVFQSWADNEPNDAFGGQMCVNLRGKSGLWVDDNCNDEFGYICRRSNGTAKPNNAMPTPRIPGGCPPGFTGLDNKCYSVNATVSVSWEAARNACRALSVAKPADIASITSHQELVLVMSLLENVTSSVYIGLNDRQQNSHFVWQSNEEVTITNWAPGQPSDRLRLVSSSSSEDCVVMNVQPDSFGLWDDVNCGEKHGYVCQTTRDPSYAAVSPVTGGCQNGYYYYRDSCYGNYRAPQTWTTAEATCVRDHGHLVSIRDIHELAAVDIFLYIDTIVNPSWIGLSYDQLSGSYSWADQWPVTFTQWDIGQPDMVKSAACVAMADGKWNDTNCNDTRTFTCKISTAAPPTTTPAPPGYCGDPTWAPNGDFCYYAAPSQQQSWPEANYLCRRMGMQLVSVHSAEEVSFVQSLVHLAVTTPSYSWLVYTPSTPKVWIGLERSLEGGFRWSDGTAANFLPWNSGEPNNENDVEDCAEVFIDSGKVNDVPCLTVSQGFVCKAPKIIPSSSSTTTTTTTEIRPSTASASSQTPSQTSMTDTQATGGWSSGSLTPNTPEVTQIPRAGTSTKRTSLWQPHQQYVPTGKTAASKQANTLRGGQVAGVVIGILGFVIIVGIIVFVVRHRGVLSKQPSGSVEQAVGFDNALYDKSHDQVSLASNGHTSGTDYVNMADC